MTETEVVALAALGISALSLVVAALSLGWNIYRDVVLKARVHVRLTVSELVGKDFAQVESTNVVLSATNHGPGKIKLVMIDGMVAQVWRRLLKRTRKFIYVPRQLHPLSHQLPIELDKGEEASILLPYREDCLLAQEFTHIGLRDSFGRQHWAPREDVRRARATYIDDFGDQD